MKTPHLFCPTFARAAGLRTSLATAVLLMTACAAAVKPIPGRLDDPRVANVVHTASGGEVQTGRLAVQRATDVRVRQFGQRMVDEHTAANQRLAMIENPTVVTDQMSTGLQRNTQQTLTSLQTYDGAAFDREYIANQVAMHAWVLHNLDGTLLPSARAADLRLFLAEVRTVVAEHLRMALELQAALQ